MNLTEKQERLLELLMAAPPDINGIEEYIESNKCSKADITIAAMMFIDACDERFCNEVECGLDRGNEHISFLYDVLATLIKYGVDPNMIYDDRNIMESLCYIGKYEGADLLSILLDGGGRFDVEIHGERLFDIVDFDVIFGAVEMDDRELYDAIVHCWMVMIGHGARLAEGDVVEVFVDDNTGKLFDLFRLKDHRKYSAFLSNVPSRENGWSLHIVDNDTMWEVARI